MAKLLPLRGYALTGSSLIVEAEQFPLADIASIQVERATSRPRSAVVTLWLALMAGLVAGLVSLGGLGFGALGFLELSRFSLNLGQLGLLTGVALLVTLVSVRVALLAWRTQGATEYYLTLIDVQGKTRRLQRLEETSDAQKLCTMVMQAKENF